MFFRRKDRPDDSAPEGAAPEVAPDALAVALKRALADAENIRRRAVQEADRARLAEREVVLRAFLEVLDNLDRALAAIDADPAGEAWRASIRSLRDQMVTTLARFGAREAVALGAPFDPAHHEAIGLVEPSDDAPPGHVAAVVLSGWVLDDGAGGQRLIRPARVLVVAEPPDDRVDEPEA